MSWIYKLIEELCPAGVEFKVLGEVYEFKYGTGNTIPTIGGKFPVYGSNGIVGMHNEYNSEDAPVIGHIGAYAGIVNWGHGKHYVTYNGVICKIKSKMVIPKYAYYQLLLNDFISIAHSGSQPFVSYGLLNKVPIPIPPLPIQQEIVNILDKFTALDAELHAELEARNKQYEFYRNQLLNFEGKEVEWKTLGEIGEFYGGLTGKNKDDFQGGNARFVTYMNVFSNITIKTDIDSFVKIGENENQNRIDYGDVLFTGSSETPDECGMSSVLTIKMDEPLYLNSFCFGFRLHDKDLFLPDFMKYLFRAEEVRKQIGQTASGVTRFNISKKRFAKIVVPILSTQTQLKIVTILDNFTQLVSEIEAEIEARRKQYEYYREKLLTFNKVEQIPGYGRPD